MKRLLSLGLLATGKVRDSYLNQIPGLADRLGPVGSSSLRLASRICGLLDGGSPVDSLREFAEVDTILIYTPENWLSGLVDALVDAPFAWRNKTVLLCDSQLDSDALRKLSFLGASTGSITPVRNFDGQLIVLEGDRKAVKQARQLVQDNDVKVLEIDRGKKALMSAGISFSTTLVLPLLAATVETLRACGMDQNEALMVSDRMFQRTLRNYVRSGKKGWTGPLPAQDSEAMRRQIYALLQRSPRLGNYFYESSLQAMQMFRRDPEWLKDVRVSALAKAAG